MIARFDLGTYRDLTQNPRLTPPPFTSAPCPNGTPYTSPEQRSGSPTTPTHRVLKERPIPARSTAPGPPNEKPSASIPGPQSESGILPATSPTKASNPSPSQHAHLQTSSRRLWTTVRITALPAHGVRLPASSPPALRPFAPSRKPPLSTSHPLNSHPQHPHPPLDHLRTTPFPGLTAIPPGDILQETPASSRRIRKHPPHSPP